MSHCDYLTKNILILRALFAEIDLFKVRPVFEKKGHELRILILFKKHRLL